MKSVRLLLLCLVCAGVCAAQEVSVQDSPPGLVVLKLKWERQIVAPANLDRPVSDASRSASDPDALNNPGGLPTRSKSPFARLPFLYLYSVEVRNDGAKKIRWASWEYVLSDPGSKKEMGRHKFASSEKIDTAKKKTLRGRTQAPPSRTVSAEGLGKDKGSPYDERVEFRCVKYDDGTWWHHPSVQESDCVEAEKRAKSGAAERRP